MSPRDESYVVEAITLLTGIRAALDEIAKELYELQSHQNELLKIQRRAERGSANR
jgi:hypothetical protein